MATHDIVSTLKVERDTTAKTIQQWLSTVPEDAKVTVSGALGDRMGESPTYSLSVRYTRSLGVE